MDDLLKTYLDFANETAFLAGRLTLDYFRSNLVIDTKSDGSVVTAADRGAETLIRERIEHYFPNHAILGEEYGSVEKPDRTTRWIIDPIDGTRSFVHGVPIYAVLIGLEINGIVEVGVAHFPAIQETISAATGRQGFKGPENEGCFGLVQRFAGLLQSRLWISLGADCQHLQDPSRLGGRLWLPAGGDRTGGVNARSGDVRMGLRPLSTHLQGSRRVFWRLERQ
jgi:hypothetical protein